MCVWVGGVFECLEWAWYVRCCDDHALNTHIRHMFCQHVLFIAADREIITVEFIRNGDYVFRVVEETVV